MKETAPCRDSGVAAGVTPQRVLSYSVRERCISYLRRLAIFKYKNGSLLSKTYALVGVLNIVFISWVADVWAAA